MTTVFFDIDTQIDFVSPAGALYVRGAEILVPHFARLNRHAAALGFRVVSTADAHAEDDAEFKQWHPHCIAGTLSQAKIPETLLDRRTVIGSSGSFQLGDAAQIIVEKQALDCFTNPNLPIILEQLAAARYVVYGVVTEYCVRCAALGLLKTGARVELVTDAVKSLNEQDSARTLDEFTAAGGVLTTVEQVCAG